MSALLAFVKQLPNPLKIAAASTKPTARPTCKLELENWLIASATSSRCPLTHCDASNGHTVYKVMIIIVVVINIPHKPSHPIK